ncbi:MAG: D-alanyl-D-alanine carboxypeptidase [Anaerostipes sp.]|jgi:D-alanyl-D-alanine carboxypeptidase (penicillin-binding protein 5/6)|nr:D-alanyl-D-alanine carboxypeptidase [Anaerostipes sp.]MDD3745546.1 D-alanyl-D-alanine carboxypeptidase [Anaerostipes sp.]
MKQYVMVCTILISLIFSQGYTPISIYASETKDMNLTAKSAIVMEESSGRVLFEQKKNEELPPASVTKVMSLLLIFEALDQGQIKKTDIVSVSEHAASMGGSQVFLETGEKQKVDDLLKCMIISSANDATVAMAEKVAGSETAFVKRMNQKAKQLGMKHTRFKNCCGLDTDQHYTSSYDIALMSRALIQKYPEVLNYTKIWMDTITHITSKGKKEFGLSNTNKMIRQYNGCNGLKTGSTGKAKFCLSATAKRNGISLIAVVMGSDSSKERIKDTSKLLDYGFSICQKIKRVTKSNEIGNFKVEKGNEDFIQSKPELVSNFVVFHSENSNDLKKIIKKKTLIAPVKKGDVIGYIIFKQKNKIIHTQKILAIQSVDKAYYLDYLKKIINQYI